jgi:hypothetical protein
MGTHKDVFIVLKKSLKWVPIVGWVSHSIPYSLRGMVLSFAADLETDVHGSGHAILQLYLLEPLLGLRPAPSLKLARLARKRSTEKGHPAHVHPLPRGHARQQGHEAHQQEIRRQARCGESLSFSLFTAPNAHGNPPYKPDMRHVLLPRSTGLHYSLRSLSPRIPGLQLIDITVAYPGQLSLDYI